MSSWYRWLKRRRLVAENPCELVGSIKVPERLPVFYDESEMQALLAAVRIYPENTERNTALVEFLYATACREEELTNIDVGDIHVGPKPWALIRRGKGKRDRVVFLTAEAVAAWEAYQPVRARHMAAWESPREQAAFLAVKNRKLRRISPHGVYDMLSTLCGFAKVRDLGVHAVRHAAATHMLNAGMDLMTLKEILGHKCLTSTQIYLHVSTERMRAQYEKAHPRA